MKLIPALVNLFRRADSAAAEAISDPIADGLLAIEDAKKDVTKFTGEIHQLMTSTRVLENQLKDAQAEVEKFEGFAKKAGIAQNRADFDEAKAAAARARTVATNLETNVKANKVLEGKLRNQLAEARSRIANAEMNKARLSATISGNKLRGNLAKASVEFAGKSDKGLSALDNLAEAAAKEEASASAWESLAADSPEAVASSLESKYGGSGASNSDNDAEFAALAKGA